MMEKGKATDAVVTEGVALKALADSAGTETLDAITRSLHEREPHLEKYISTQIHGIEPDQEEK